ncbi:MAG: tRNA lysidine(34) synthetase TilS [Candidatus Omnitrophica bacterium]|nr:tRNA lysidine(34) synthetase TilS [Candidatus Omnitrophota bacterium]
MKEKMLDTMNRHSMLAPGDSVYVAVSGGQDSVCLLDGIMQIRNDFKLTVGIIHINHLLRQEDSNKDAAFVQSLAKQYKVPLFVKDIDVKAIAQQQKLSIEDAARKCRYFAFVEFAKEKKIHKIAIAHTKNDQAETVLMRILRGTGLKGFRSIHPTMVLNDVTFIRPLIDISRQEIETYATQNKIRFRMDMSNKSIRFFRNKVRHELLPLLADEYNPQIQNALVRMSESVQQDYQYLSEVADGEYKRALKKEKQDIVVLNGDIVDSLHAAVKYRVIIKALNVLDPSYVFEFSHWDRYKEEISKKRKYSAPMGKGLIFEVSGHDIVLKKQRDRMHYEYFVHGDQNVVIKEANIVIDFCAVDEPVVHKSRAKGKELVDHDKLSFPLIVRNRKDGDRMKPLGMRFEKKIKDILIDKKVPHYVRDELPILISKGKIVWCWGVGIADTFKISSHTKRGFEIGAEYLNGATKRA